MSKVSNLLLIRLLPVVLITVAAYSYVADVERPVAYVLRNAVPFIVLIVLAAITLYRGGGTWNGEGCPCTCITRIRSVSKACLALLRIPRNSFATCPYIPSLQAESALQSAGLSGAMYKPVIVRVCRYGAV